MMYIVTSNDGTTEYDSVMQNALARVLINMTEETKYLIINELDVDEEDIKYDTGDGVISITKDPNTFKTETLVYNLTSDQREGVKQLGVLANSALTLRDSLMINLLSTILKPKSNKINFKKNNH